MKKQFTEDIELRNEILSKLKENKEKYGECYCPCVIPSFYSEDTICPCKNFREEVSVGEECHCGLYIKISQD